ncbi:MAG: hypothetical protein AAFR61_15310 [Bacteroidota bacterium]
MKNHHALFFAVAFSFFVASPFEALASKGAGKAIPYLEGDTARSQVRIMLPYPEGLLATEAPTDEGEHKFGVCVGGALTSLKLISSSSLDYEITGVTFSPSLSPVGGLFYQYVVPKNKGSWAFYNEVGYYGIQAKGQLDTVFSASLQRTYDVEVNYRYLKINNAARYAYPVGGLHIFGQFGICTGLALTTEYINNVTINFLGNVRTEDANFTVREAKVDYGLFSGAGIQKDKLFLELRYERGTGPTYREDFGSISSRFLLLLGFQL